MAEAAQYIFDNEPRAATVAIIGRSAIGADGITVAVGALGTATAGDRGTASSASETAERAFFMGGLPRTVEEAGQASQGVRRL